MHASHVVKGAIAGAAAGLVASFVMNQFQSLWSAMAGAGADGQEEEGGEPPATEKAADAVAQTLTGEPVPGEHKAKAGEAVHYATGAAVGAVYGALAEVFPQVTRGGGAAYGGTVALGLDEGLVPALGLGPGPTETPPATHAYGMVSHLVFGWALEAARRTIRPAL